VSDLVATRTDRPNRKRLDFRPPKPSAPVLWLAEVLLPTVLKRGYGIVSVRYEPEELERLRNLPAPVLLTPNHPTHAEPAVMFHLAKTLGQRLRYLSNREAFGFAWGLFGFLLQRCGAYSIVRGAPDRESFALTRRLLSTEPARLVIFPEGEVYSQNDTLLPFQAGVFQLAFMALEESRKAGIDAPLFIQPVAIRYRFVDDMGKKIVEAMEHLERHLNLPLPPPGTSYARLRRIGDAVLAAAERAYGLPAGDPEDLNPRIDAVRNKIVERVADALHVQPETLGKTLPDRMRALMNRLTGVAPDDDNPESWYEERLQREEAERARPLIRDLQRLANWLAVRDGYVAENPTQERMVDTLWRLESEVLGVRILKGRRECRVRLAEPFDLREHAAAYPSAKREAIRSVTERVEGAVQGLLSELSS
jgi:1-acyl-sn-glycerol-3-phosphate acyltransferase